MDDKQVEELEGAVSEKKKRKKGGKIEGETPKHRLDKRARGGHMKSHKEKK